MNRDGLMGWGYYMSSIGNRVRALRVSKRLSQQELADKMGISQPAIAKIERGITKKMEGGTLDSLARELSSTAGYILHGATDAEGHEHALIAAEMVAIFRDLPLADKETILRMARAILPASKTLLLSAPPARNPEKGKTTTSIK